MNQREILPNINEKQGYSTFCRNYLAYRESVKAERDKFNNRVLNAENALRETSKSVERIPRAVEEAEDKISFLEGQVSSLSGKRSAMECSVAGTMDLHRQAEADVQTIRAHYLAERKQVEKEAAVFDRARAQNKSYLELLEKNRDLYYRMMAYKKPAEQRVEALMNAFPTQVDRIQKALEGPLVELVGSDYTFEERFHSYQEATGTFEPIKFMATIDYIIKPELYPYDFLQKKDFLRTRILMILLLVIGIVLAFRLHSVFIPIAVVLSLFPVSGLRKKHASQLTDSLDPKELNLYHTILAYTEKDIERLTRKSEKLPEGSAKDYRSQCEKKIAQMEQEMQEASKKAGECTGQLLTFRLKQKALKEEYAEITANAQRENSRLHEALRRKREGVELTENMARLIQEYDARIADWTTRNDKNEYNVDYLEKQIKKSQSQSQTLEQEIREARTRNALVLSRLEQLEELLGGKRISADDRIAELNRQEELEIQAVWEKVEQDKKRRAKAHEADMAQKIRGIQKEIESAKAQLEAAREEKKRLLGEQKDAERVLKEAKDRAAQEKQRYEAERALYARLNTGEVWRENLSRWKNTCTENSELEGKHAGEDIIRSDATEFVVGDECYIMGSTGPYALPHKCSPVVLTYDVDESEQSLQPGVLLNKTITAIRRSIDWSNRAGLAEFALVSDAVDDRFGNEITCYTERQLDELDRRVGELRQSLKDNREYGVTVKDFNRKYSQKMLASNPDYQENPDKMVHLLKKTLFVFVLPKSLSDGRPLNHEGLWEKMRGNCADYGFVPVFFIPQKQWNLALSSEGQRTGLATAILQLDTIASDHAIVLNGR